MVKDGSPEFNSGTTSYRLPVVTIGLSLTVFPVLWSPGVPDREIDPSRWMHEIGLATDGC